VGHSVTRLTCGNCSESPTALALEDFAAFALPPRPVETRRFMMEKMEKSCPTLGRSSWLQGSQSVKDVFRSVKAAFQSLVKACQPKVHYFLPMARSARIQECAQPFDEARSFSN